MSFYPFTLEDDTIQDRTYVTYLLNGEFGDLEIEKHIEEVEEIIESILEAEKGRVRSQIIGSYEVEL